MAFINKNGQTGDNIYNYCLSMNFNNICRICLEKGPKLMPIFDPIKPPHFSVLIMACASVQVTRYIFCFVDCTCSIAKHLSTGNRR